MNKHFLQKNGWKVVTSCLSVSEEKNVEHISTFIDQVFKPISYKNTSSKRSLKKIFLNFLWPDKGIFWALKTFFILTKRFLNQRNQKYLLVTVSYPFSSHLLGACLKLLFPKRIQLVTHYIDAFYLINKGNGAPLFLAPLSLLAERFAHKMADKVIINNNKSAEFESLFTNLIFKKNSVDELPGLYLTDFNSENVENGRCLFAGSLYRNIRNPKKVFDLFYKLSNLKLKIAGNLNDCVDILQEFEFEYLGLLNDDQIIEQLKKAEILINIDNQDHGQQPPGKLIEYMLLQKPIINFYSEKSLSGKVLEKFACSQDSYLEINLADDMEKNLLKISQYKVPKGKIFEISNRFENLYELYSKIT
jgi:hypothetical protein